MTGLYFRWSHPGESFFVNPSALRFCLLTALLILAGSDLAAQTDANLPRFAALRSSEVNLRAGPGVQYPVEWVFLRRSLPIEITAEYGHWRKVRDADGSEGWVHKSLLTGRRSALVIGAVRSLFSDPDAASATIARAEPGVVAALLACADGWCRIEVDGHKGWLPAAHLWGVYDGETVE